jgi:flagellar hook assembly protein FlgD
LGCRTLNPSHPGGNTVPVISAATYDATTDVLTVQVTDPDAGDNVTVTVSVPAGLQVDATQKVISTSGTVNFHWSATSAAAGGTGDTTVRATDEGGAFATRTATITVEPVVPGATPVIGAVTYDAASGLLTVPVTDADGGNVTVTVTAVAGLNVDNLTQTVAVPGNALLHWSAADAHAGGAGDTTIGAADAEGHNATTATQTITIASVNAAPVIGAVTYVAAMGVLTVPVTDADNDDVTVTVTVPTDTQVDHATATVTGGNGNAVFTFSLVAPATNATGDSNITADDAHGGTDTATQAITLGSANNAPVIGTVTYAGGVLTVPVTDPDNDDVTVTVTDVAGFTVDNNTQVVTGGNGNAIFHWTPGDIITGASGDTTITADDGRGGVDTLVFHLSDGPSSFEADTLYPFVPGATAAVGAPVTVYVVTGMPAHPLQFLTSVGFTCETAGTYVANSFNYGVPGGGRAETDGYWALMGPPAPTVYLDLGDALVPGAAVDVGGGLHRYNFAIVPQGIFAAPASMPGNAAVLFNFQLTFSAAGTYNFGFQLNDGSFDQTYYSDGASNNYFWGTLQTDTVTVN